MSSYSSHRLSHALSSVKVVEPHWCGPMTGLAKQCYTGGVVAASIAESSSQYVQGGIERQTCLSCMVVVDHSTWGCDHIYIYIYVHLLKNVCEYIHMYSHV